MTLYGLFIGFVVVSWQLARQTQDRLKVDLYDKLAERIEATTLPLVELGGLPTAFVGELTIRASIWAAHGNIATSTYFNQVQPQLHAASRSVLSLTSLLETYAIVMPEFSIFRRRLHEELQFTTVATNDFAQAAFQFAGSDNAGPIRWPPSKEETDLISSLATAVMNSSFSLSAVVSDLRVEAQNYLLSDTFGGRRLPARVPADPSMKVTTIAKVI